ncbi:hypothetical protein EZV62_003665 [Acer yangbiense]|uniref:Serine-threonine/tyrosine-protein kinase catalytic domain-containing protein n=1 Tax=Acer yangbiense TaxID=1000413 RepID=A0A5C7IHF8_9ROSI|nr:hypothetical protein EZV62_003665 [Acer yangbiense]
MRISRDEQRGTLQLSQAEYIRKVLQRFNMSDAKLVKITSESPKMVVDKTVADSLSWEKRLQIATEAALGDIKNVVDPRLHGDFDINSVWKAVEIAMACVSPNSAKRPTMAQVVMELNECLAIQTTDRGEVDDETNLKDYVELVNLNLHSELFPLARNGNGDVAAFDLYKKVADILNWEKRLQIATEAALAKRPTMNQVVTELNECLAIETGCGEVDDETDLKDSVELVNFNMHSEISPLAR